MTRIAGTTYRCDQCNREERESSQVLNWLSVRILRDEVAPQRGGITWRRDFCSRQCLAKWARDMDFTSECGGEPRMDIAKDTTS